MQVAQLLLIFRIFFIFFFEWLPQYIDIAQPPGFYFILLGLTKMAIFVSWHRTNAGYTAVYGNLNLSDQAGSSNPALKVHRPAEFSSNLKLTFFFFFTAECYRGGLVSVNISGS